MLASLNTFTQLQLSMQWFFMVSSMLGWLSVSICFLASWDKYEILECLVKSSSALAREKGTTWVTLYWLEAWNHLD